MAEPSEQHRMLAAFGYLLPPVVPLTIMTSAAKDDPFMRRHAAQAMVWTVGLLAGFVGVVILAIWLLRTDALFICLMPFVLLLPFLPGAWWAWQVYRGGDPRPALLAPISRRLFSLG